MEVKSRFRHGRVSCSDKHICLTILSPVIYVHTTAAAEDAAVVRVWLLSLSACVQATLGACEGNILIIQLDLNDQPYYRINTKRTCVCVCLCVKEKHG